MSEPTPAANAAQDDDSDRSDPPAAPHSGRSWPLAVLLFALTCGSTSYVAWGDEGAAAALRYSVPLMAILLAHEFGHYIAARIHRVPASPPFFIPLPIGPLGTMGAVILMPDRITRRDALLDIGAAGPLAGLAVAVPVLVYGIATSEVLPLDPRGGYLLEGHSLLYRGLLYALKGPIPDGHDIMLNATAFAGWAGLLVTMLNLIPAVQLDGGHVAHALFGERHERFSRLVRASLLPVALAAGLYYAVPAYLEGARGEALWAAASPAMQWLIWWLLLRLMGGMGKGREHPPTDDAVLSPRRRIVASVTLLLFFLLVMPGWLRYVPPAAAAG